MSAIALASYLLVAQSTETPDQWQWEECVNWQPSIQSINAVLNSTNFIGQVARAELPNVYLDVMNFVSPVAEDMTQWYVLDGTGTTNQVYDNGYDVFFRVKPVRFVTMSWDYIPPATGYVVNYYYSGGTTNQINTAANDVIISLYEGVQYNFFVTATNPISVTIPSSSVQWSYPVVPCSITITKQ